MNFPMEQPLFHFLYWLINTPGIGGIIVIMIAIGLISSFGLTLRWIINGGKAEQDEEYTFPTSSLLGHGNHHDETE